MYMTYVLKLLDYIESQRGYKIVNVYHFVSYVYSVYFIFNGPRIALYVSVIIQQDATIYSLNLAINQLNT